VRTVAHGDALLAPTITRRLIEEFTSGPSPGAVPPELEALDPAEREVLKLIAEGLSNAEIAERLEIGESAVANQVAGVLDKLGLRDRAQAVVVAYRTGLAR
jgi:DNA-binding NarL/FixJ family response regulator